jgi:hypothetical protein
MRFFTRINWRVRVAIRRFSQRTAFLINKLKYRLKSTLKIIVQSLLKLQERRLILNFKSLFAVSCMIFLFLWLKKHLLTFFNDIIIANTFDKLDVSPFGYSLGTFYLLLALISIIYCSTKFLPGKFKPAAIPVFFLLFSSTTYGIERICKWHYNFQMLFSSKGFIGKIAVLDPLFITTFCFGLGYIIAEIVLPPVLSENTFINPDHPITDTVGDEFEREVFVEKMANWLNGLKLSTEKSFVLGINGNWGFGKTS